MTIRLLGSLGTIALIGAASLSSHPVAAQEQGAAPPLVITAFGEKTAPPYAARRTSWGEPDLQGVWSSDDTAGIPMQRPEQFGNRLYLNEEEYAERAKTGRERRRPRRERGDQQLPPRLRAPRVLADVVDRRSRRRADARLHTPKA